MRCAEARGVEAVTDLGQTEKIRQVERLAHLYRESMAAWRRSKADHLTNRSRQTDTPDGTTKLAEDRTDERVGDARLLDVARGTLTDMRKILGLEVLKMEHLNQPVARPVADLTDLEFDTKLAELNTRRSTAERPH